ncbi:MAG TPA: L-lysine 2,3-aminomutase [Hyphomicrobiaceae bacterium MAG_BT-2024]
MGIISEQDVTTLHPVAERYAIAVTRHICERMDPNDQEDPIRQQFIPHTKEMQHLDDELEDPISDEVHSPVRGIVHRYSNRALLKIVNICPIYCRFCFRREMIGQGFSAVLDAETISKALDYVANTPQLEELIVTGGDPFVLSAKHIKDFTKRVTEISHIKKLRWHTRVPILTPERISEELVEALTSTNCKVRVAIHANHANEFSNRAQIACQLLFNAGIELLSQSVLLRGINDNVQDLENLCREFSNIKATLYYLHHCDLAPGTARFRTTLAKGLKLMQKLRKRLAENLIPSYILDVPGGLGKINLAPERVRQLERGVYKIKLKDNLQIKYRDVLFAK